MAEGLKYWSIFRLQLEVHDLVRCDPDCSRGFNPNLTAGTFPVDTTSGVEDKNKRAASEATRRVSTRLIEEALFPAGSGAHCWLSEAWR